MAAAGGPGLNFTIKFMNAGEVIAGLQARKINIGGKLRQGAAEAGAVIDRNVKSLCPVDTGQLKGSYHYVVGGGGMVVWVWYGTNGAFSENGYNYAYVQEYKYRPHLRPGFMASIGDIKSAFRRALLS